MHDIASVAHNGVLRRMLTPDRKILISGGKNTEFKKERI